MNQVTRPAFRRETRKKMKTKYPIRILKEALREADQERSDYFIDYARANEELKKTTNAICRERLKKFMKKRLLQYTCTHTRMKDLTIAINILEK